MNPSTGEPLETLPESAYDEAMPGQTWRHRRRALARLFEAIEPRYDRLNRRLSGGLDQMWRKGLARSIDSAVDGPWLDLASGTGDLAVFVERRRVELESPTPLLRLDLSAALLRTGGTKVATPAVAGEMDALPVPDESLAVIVQGFALRHCRDYASFFRELFRVLRPGGQVRLLDMRYPRRGWGSSLYRFYFRRVLPHLAALFGADRKAYHFMVDSVRSMPSEAQFIEDLERAGFVEVRSKPGFLGSVAVLSARRP